MRRAFPLLKKGNMQHSSSIAAATRNGGALLPALTLSLLLSAATPSPSEGAGAPNLRDLVKEFNSICTDLEVARRDLQSRGLDEGSFGDRILDLFVRADSISNLLEARAPLPRTTGTAFALDWGLRHLRASLRENYEGIVEHNGYHFVTADLSLKAAHAWQGRAVEAATVVR
jgi:hypothetical protein